MVPDLKIFYMNLAFYDKSVAFAVYIQNFYNIISLKIFPQFGYINIHTSGGKLSVITPNFRQGQFSRHKVILMQSKQP